MCVCACEPVLLYPVLCLVSQSCPAPCYSMDSSVHGFPRQEYWSGLPCPPPGDYPDLGMEPMSLALQVDPLPSEPPGKPTNTGVGSLSLLQGIFLTQESNQGFRKIVYQLSYQGSPVFFVYSCQLGCCLSKLKSPNLFCLFIEGYFSLQACWGWCGVWGREW